MRSNQVEVQNQVREKKIQMYSLKKKKDLIECKTTTWIEEK